MKFFKEKHYTNLPPNFIGSEVGLINKTRQFTDTGIVENSDKEKIVKAGTVYPANDATAQGIVFEDVDVTLGEAPGAVIVAGRILKDRLPIVPSAEAMTALKASGIVFDTVEPVSRG